jgi:mannose-1-phosphate guanylyltransferase
MNDLVPVILSGGIGARLWPVSRAAHPKPFMKLPDGESLLEKTLKNLAAIPHTAAEDFSPALILAAAPARGGAPSVRRDR